MSTGICFFQKKTILANVQFPMLIKYVHPSEHTWENHTSLALQHNMVLHQEVKWSLAETSLPLSSEFEGWHVPTQCWKKLIQGVMINNLYICARGIPNKVLKGPFFTLWTHHYCTILRKLTKMAKWMIVRFPEALYPMLQISVDILQMQSKKDDMQGLYCNSHHKQ